MNNILTVAIGGAFGSTLRYLMGLGLLSLFGKGFPFSTLSVNILGSFIMGIVYQSVQQGTLSQSPWWPLVGMGFLGALTTFSSFSLDTLLLMQQGFLFKATLNVLLNVVVCLVVVYIGMLFAIKS
ncbi:MAG: fluoride efflux transporter CrcB [Psychromonas sp.]|nr:fluoride efflux transporter CrcB [Psychromonas sp.]